MTYALATIARVTHHFEPAAWVREEDVDDDREGEVLDDRPDRMDRPIGRRQRGEEPREAGGHHERAEPVPRLIAQATRPESENDQPRRSVRTAEIAASSSWFDVM